MTEGTSSSEALERLFEKSSLTIVVVSVLFTAAMMQVLMGFPGFTTEISSFAPESDSDSSENRINEEMGAAPHLLYIDVRPYSESADGGNACDDSPCNVLELGALQQLAVDLERIEQYSNDNGDFILSHLNTAGIIQTALDERDEQARNLSEFSDWVELLDAVSDGEECSDAIGNDQAIASASFAASAMLHSDFDYDPVCEWLDTGEGNPSPVASSTMWVIEISGDISNEDRRDLSAGIR
ncbi:MAG: hypothetical protein VX184_00480, partial [Candidatus Thermoplasmatota archaeon]|nr:hypothetical protein [Candidatus Thermoplasmatota archaeon]